MMFLSSIKVKSDKKFSFEEIDRETGAAYFKVEDFKNKYEKKTSHRRNGEEAKSAILLKAWESGQKKWN